MSMANEEYHLAFGMSDAASLRRALVANDPEVRVFPLPNDMALGPINPPSPALRRGWYKQLRLDDEADLVDWWEASWEKATALSSTLYVWFCRTNANDNASLHEFIWRRGNQPVRLIDVSGRNVLYGDRSYPITTIGMAGPEFLASFPYEQTEPLTDQQIRAFHEEWRKLKDENAPVRINDGGMLASADIDVFDEYVLSFGSADWRRGARIVGNAMVGLSDLEQPGVSVEFLWSRIRVLAEAGILDVTGDLSDMHTTRIRIAAQT